MYDHYSKICFGPADSNLNVFCNQFGCYFRDLISPWKITLHLNFEMWEIAVQNADDMMFYAVRWCDGVWYIGWRCHVCAHMHSLCKRSESIQFFFFFSLIHFGWLLLKSVWATAFWISSWQNDECNATMAIILFDRFLVLSVQYLSLSVLSEWICFCHRLCFFFLWWSS